MWNTIKEFYNSKTWIKFRHNVIQERSLKNNGLIICEYCGKPIKEAGDVEVDHIKELTLENVNDFNISLNPENVAVSCHRCHDKKHERFGNARERLVHIVYGPPLSGKATYVKNNMVRGDLIVDMDRLFSAISFFDLFDKPEVLKYNVFAIRNLLLDNIETRYGKFRNAWIIGGYANKREREKLAERLGADLIFMDVPKEECISRIRFCTDNRQYMQSEWRKYIDKWFEEYTP